MGRGGRTAAGQATVAEASNAAIRSTLRSRGGAAGWAEPDARTVALRSMSDADLAEELRTAEDLAAPIAEAVRRAAALSEPPEQEALLEGLARWAGPMFERRYAGTLTRLGIADARGVAWRARQVREHAGKAWAERETMSVDHLLHRVGGQGWANAVAVSAASPLDVDAYRREQFIRAWCTPQTFTAWQAAGEPYVPCRPEAFMDAVWPAGHVDDARMQRRIELAAERLVRDALAG